MKPLSKLLLRKPCPRSKKVVDEGGTLVFLDETGSSLKTTVGRTWAPRGQTPVIKTHLKWHSLSIIGALTSDGRVFQHTHRHAVRAAQVVDFLEHLLFFVAGPVTVVLDRAAIHRAKQVQDWLVAHPRLRLVYLPAYAPEFNPVELLWAYIKRQVLTDFVARDLRHLKRRWAVGFAQVRARHLARVFFRFVTRSPSASIMGTNHINVRYQHLIGDHHLG